MLLGGPCANPLPPHFLHHLHLVGFSSWGASFFRALLLLLPLGGDSYLPLPAILAGEGDLFLGGDSYRPLADLEGEGDLDALPVLRLALLLEDLPLRDDRSGEPLLTDAADMALSSSSLEV